MPESNGSYVNSLSVDYLAGGDKAIQAITTVSTMTNDEADQLVQKYLEEMRRRQSDELREIAVWMGLFCLILPCSTLFISILIAGPTVLAIAIAYSVSRYQLSSLRKSLPLGLVLEANHWSSMICGLMYLNSEGGSGDRQMHRNSLRNEAYEVMDYSKAIISCIGRWLEELSHHKEHVEGKRINQLHRFLCLVARPPFKWRIYRACTEEEEIILLLRALHVSSRIFNHRDNESFLRAIEQGIYKDRIGLHSFVETS